MTFRPTSKTFTHVFSSRHNCGYFALRECIWLVFANSVFSFSFPVLPLTGLLKKFLTNCYEIFGRIGFGARNKQQWIRFRGWSGSAAQTGPQRFPGDACCSVVVNSTSRFIEIICRVYNKFIGNVCRPNCPMIPFFSGFTRIVISVSYVHRESKTYPYIHS